MLAINNTYLGPLVSVITWTCQPIHLAPEKQHLEPGPGGYPSITAEISSHNRSHYNWWLWTRTKYVILWMCFVFSEDLCTTASQPLSLIQLVYAAFHSDYPRNQEKKSKSKVICFCNIRAQWYIDVFAILRKWIITFYMVHRCVSMIFILPSKCWEWPNCR